MICGLPSQDIPWGFQCTVMIVGLLSVLAVFPMLFFLAKLI